MRPDRLTLANAADVIGWTHDGAVYCPECAPKAGRPDDPEAQQREEWAPIFRSDEWFAEHHCGRCGRTVTVPAWRGMAEEAARQVERVEIVPTGPDRPAVGPDRLRVRFEGADLRPGLEWLAGPGRDWMRGCYAEDFVHDVARLALKRFGLRRQGWSYLVEDWTESSVTVALEWVARWGIPGRGKGR